MASCVMYGLVFGPQHGAGFPWFTPSTWTTDGRQSPPSLSSLVQHVIVPPSTHVQQLSQLMAWKSDWNVLLGRVFLLGTVIRATLH